MPKKGLKRHRTGEGGVDKIYKKLADITNKHRWLKKEMRLKNSEISNLRERLKELEQRNLFAKSDGFTEGYCQAREEIDQNAS